MQELVDETKMAAGGPSGTGKPYESPVWIFSSIVIQRITVLSSTSERRQIVWQDL